MGLYANEEKNNVNQIANSFFCAIINLCTRSFRGTKFDLQPPVPTFIIFFVCVHQGYIPKVSLVYIRVLVCILIL